MKLFNVHGIISQPETEFMGRILRAQLNMNLQTELTSLLKITVCKQNVQRA
jgi:hypothetical protein